MKIKTGKKYQTVSGYDVDIVAVTGHKDHPVLGYIGGRAVVYSWTEDGFYFSRGVRDNYDLVEVKSETADIVGYVNAYAVPGGRYRFGGNSYATRTAADAAAKYAQPRVACVRITYKEGQFDD